MVSDYDEFANVQQPQNIDSSIMEYVATGIMSLELFHRELSWGDFANSTALVEELLFPDDEDIIEYLNELTQEAKEEQRREKIFCIMHAEINERLILLMID